MKRNRFLYGGLTILIMAAGLLSRKAASSLPVIVNDYLGDALWAMMIFFGFAFLFSKSRRRSLLFSALIFCFLIEFSQLYHAEWLDAIRRTTLGGLILGYGFLWRDLVAYTMGVLTGALIDYTLQKKQ